MKEYEVELTNFINEHIRRTITSLIKSKYTTVKNACAKLNIPYTSINNVITNGNYIRVDAKGDIVIRKRILQSKLNLILFKGKLIDIINAAMNNQSINPWDE